MTRSWRPDGDPITSAAGGRWMWPRWLRRRGPVRVEAGSARPKQHGRPLGSRPAAVVNLSPAAVTEGWPWWLIGRLVVLLQATPPEPVGVQTWPPRPFHNPSSWWPKLLSDLRRRSARPPAVGVNKPGLDVRSSDPGSPRHPLKTQTLVRRPAASAAEPALGGGGWRWGDLAAVTQAVGASSPGVPPAGGQGPAHQVQHAEEGEDGSDHRSRDARWLAGFEDRWSCRGRGWPACGRRRASGHEPSGGGREAGRAQ